MKKILPAIALILCILIFSARAYEAKNEVLRPDEAAWIFSTVYLRHIAGFDWQNKDWSELDAYDHPPVAKYYYGLSLLSTTGPWKDLADKSFWLNQSAGFADAEALSRELSRRVPYEALFMARVAETISAILAACGVLALATLLAGPAVGAASLVVFSLSRMVMHFVPIVEPDFLLMAVTLFSLCFTIEWLRSLRRKDAILAGAFLGLAFGIKLSAIVQIPAVFVAMFCAILFSQERKRVALSAASLAVSFLFVSFILNPTILFSPLLALGKMFEHRAIQMEAVRFFGGMDTVSPIFPTIVGLKQIFIFMGMPIDQVLPIGLVLFSAGTVYLFSKIYAENKKFRPDLLVFFVCAALWISAAFLGNVVSMRLRYLLPVAPFVAILCGAGVVALAKAFSRPREMIRSRSFYLSLGLFVAIFLLMGVNGADETISQAESSPKVLKRKFEMLAHRNPNLLPVQEALVNLSVAENDYAGAIEASHGVTKIYVRAGNFGNAYYYEMLSRVLEEQQAAYR